MLDLSLWQMAASNESEIDPLLVGSIINQSLSDSRTEPTKKRAIYFVVACTLFERIAFYALVNTLFSTLRWYDPFNWTNVHSQTASFIFSGK